MSLLIMLWRAKHSLCTWIFLVYVLILFLADLRAPSCWSVLLWGWRYVWLPWLWCQVIWRLCEESDGLYVQELGETLCPASGAGREGRCLKFALHDTQLEQYVLMETTLPDFNMYICRWNLCDRTCISDFAGRRWESGHSVWHKCLSNTAERWDCGVYTRNSVTYR